MRTANFTLLASLVVVVSGQQRSGTTALNQVAGRDAYGDAVNQAACKYPAQSRCRVSKPRIGKMRRVAGRRTRSRSLQDSVRAQGTTDLARVARCELDFNNCVREAPGPDEDIPTDGAAYNVEDCHMQAPFIFSDEDVANRYHPDLPPLPDESSLRYWETAPNGRLVQRANDTAFDQYFAEWYALEMQMAADDILNLTLHCDDSRVPHPSCPSCAWMINYTAFVYQTYEAELTDVGYYLPVRRAEARIIPTKKATAATDGCTSPPPSAPTANCKNWCEKHTNSWDIKCKWSTNTCSGCDACTSATSYVAAAGAETRPLKLGGGRQEALIALDRLEK